MTTIRHASIRCDECRRSSGIVRAMQWDDGAQGLRRELRKQGWRRFPGYYPYGKDYCDTCAPKHPEAK